MLIMHIFFSWKEKEEYKNWLCNEKIDISYMTKITVSVWARWSAESLNSPGGALVWGKNARNKVLICENGRTENEKYDNVVVCNIIFCQSNDILLCSSCIQFCTHFFWSCVCCIWVCFIVSAPTGCCIVCIWEKVDAQRA